tara:strand:+ start:1443 stop:2243 length:801 start_codon:yes stop_codon:yes gene_type:complete
MTMIPTLTDCQLTLENGVATLLFDRHDVRNELTGTAIAADIVRVCEWINSCSNVGVLIMTGAGSSFCAGGNIHDMAERRKMFAMPPMEIQEHYRRGIQAMALAVYGLEVPAIAAINGPAVGAGLDLACMCDIRMGSPRTKMGETFVNLGIIPGDGGAWFLPRIVGDQRAAEMAFSGRIISAEEALDYGLLLEVVPADDLASRSQTLAREFAAKPRTALRIAKRLLRSGRRMELPDFLDMCAGLQSLCHTTEEHDDALAAMVASLRK